MAVVFVDQAVDQLRENFRGEVLDSASPGYDEARKVWNGVIDRKPAIIARCSGTADVVAAVNFARENELLVSIRGGGHNVAGNAVNDGGIVIDLVGYADGDRRPDARTAHVQGGATWGDVDTRNPAVRSRCARRKGVDYRRGRLHAAWWHELDAKKGGVAVDNLRSVEMVLAEGQVCTASERQ